MAQIGNLGKLIVFEVSSDKVLTFSKLSQTVKGRWTSHTPIMKRREKEFLGPDSRQLTLQIRLSAMLGVKPRAMLNKLEKAVEKGKAYPLILNGEKIGKYQWVITSMSESWDVIMTRGELLSCSVSLTLEEYMGGEDGT